MMMMMVTMVMAMLMIVFTYSILLHVYKLQFVVPLLAGSSTQKFRAFCC